jgi:Sigma-54 interaction domain
MVIRMPAGYIDPNATPTGIACGMAMTRGPERGPFEPDLCRSPLSSPNWAQLAIDIRIAARNKVPVLISAPPDFAASVARAIAAFADEWRPIEVVVCDCAGGADLGAAVANARSARGLHAGEVILLLREVHTLGAADQAAVADLVAAWHAGRSLIRIISTCSVSLFDRVREGAFDEQLFYRLNALHIAIQSDSWRSGD